MMRINEDYIEDITQDDIVVKDEQQDDDYTKATQMKKALGLYMSKNDHPEAFEGNNMVNFSKELNKKINRLFSTNAAIGDYVLTDWQFGQTEYDNLFEALDMTNGDALHFYVFFDDDFKTSQNVIWFFNKINEYFWDTYHKVISDSDDFYYKASLYLNKDNKWEDVTDYELDFEEFMDRDYLSQFETNFWLYYKVLKGFDLHEKSYSTLSSICNPGINISEMMVGVSHKVGFSVTRRNDVKVEISDYLKNRKFLNLKEYILNDNDGNVKFFQKDADENPMRMFWTTSEISKEYVGNNLNWFEGLPVCEYLETDNDVFHYFIFYMGCYWVDNIHKHMFMTVYLPYKEKERSKQTLINIFGEVDKYFEEEFS